MAAIDKIYGNTQHYDALRDWLLKNKKEFVKYLYPRQEDWAFPIANFPKEADIYLIKNCPLKFVQESLKEQYLDYKPKTFKENI